MHLSAKHRKTLQKIFHRPVLGTIRWKDIENLFEALGAKKVERGGSRVAIIINGSIHVFHRPHPKPNTDKGAVETVKRVLQEAFPDMVRDFTK